MEMVLSPFSVAGSPPRRHSFAVGVESWMAAELPRTDQVCGKHRVFVAFCASYIRMRRSLFMTMTSDMPHSPHVKSDPAAAARPATAPLRNRLKIRGALMIRALGPAMSRPKPAETLRAALGAGLGLAVCGIVLLALEAWRGGSSDFLLIAPLGATAFLVFAVPNSPLAQPWSAVVENSVSALAAVAILSLNLGTELSAGLGVGGAILAMALLRAMHPPGAAVALATVKPAPAGQHATADASPERRLGLSADDLAAVLDRFNLSANIGAEDFGRILAAAEAEAARRYFDDLTCSDVMSRDLVCVTEETRLGRVADLFRVHGFKTLPVSDNDGRLPDSSARTI
ncbi:HPP family protein [Stappia sp. TSB10GB4]|uniref:HPP family protein n=1 Tax=Stappia sp. TSB10GB4 TaxID=2003584 RepID=UPI001645A675|nr:HPP family protein [Stappia sp. TSB10GB4]